VADSAVVRRTMDGCRSACYRPPDYRQGAVPSRESGVPDPDRSGERPWSV